MISCTICIINVTLKNIQSWSKICLCLFQVGPAGAQFGLIACLIVEVLNVWPMLRHPQHALCKLLAITFVLFLFGLLPWVDNFAHLFGFVFGFLLSYALLPFVSFGDYDRQKKIFLIWVCIFSVEILIRICTVWKISCNNTVQPPVQVEIGCFYF